ncbi:DNA polymerase III subunit theta [Raoultella ornithinolytica]|nr:DNA polymerase III subunit theta [Raoultella ornithinolytica]HAT1563799.1 DNA polymerase III subunit theta [Raoultella ornithinolytica]HDT6091288.1 DNA polymerase III subunit theta [Raoultella ornithinolytica]
MSKWNIAAKPKEEQDKVNVDLAASGVAYKERLNMPVVAEVVAREQPEHLRDYFMDRVRFYREQSAQLPRPSDPRYIEMAAQNEKNKPIQFNPLRRVFYATHHSRIP